MNRRSARQSERAVNRSDRQGQTAAVGMAAAMGASAIAKFSSVIAQIALGWLLAPEEFADYAIAIAMATITWSLRNGGIYKLLVQRGDQYADLAAGFFRVALAFNLLIMVILVLLGYVAELVYRSEAVRLVMWVLALATPLGSLAVVLRAKLAITRRFSELARIESICAVVRYGSMIAFALAGFGVFSFVLPHILVALVETWLAQRCAGGLPRGPASWRSNWRSNWRSTLVQSKWVMATSLVIAASLYFDYLVIGLLEDKVTLGTYFFAFQLTISISVLFTTGIDTVVLSALSEMREETARQAASFRHALRVGVLAVTGLTGTFVLVIGPLVSWVWSGKWDSAIPVAQLFMVTLVTRLPLSVAFSLLEAKAQWRTRASLQAIDVAGLAIAVTVGAVVGGLLEVAVMSSMYRLIAGAVLIVVAVRVAGLDAGEIAKELGRAILAGVIAFALALLVTGQMRSQYSGTALLVIVTAAFIMSFSLLARVLAKRHCEEAWGLLSLFFRKRSSRVPR